MYHQAGRLPQLPCLEDEAFHKALLRKDAKIRKSPAVKVVTSNRHEGRVSIGLSEQLKKWKQMETDCQAQVVPCALEIIARFTCRHNIRLCWNEAAQYGTYNRSKLLAAARELQIPTHWLRHELESSSYFGQLWESIEQNLHAGGWPEKWNLYRLTKRFQI